MNNIVYFDTNIYHHLYKRYHITEENYRSLRSAIHAGQILILPSLLNIEELLGAFEKHPDLARKKIRILLELVDFQKLIKPPDMLLHDDIVSYAHESAPNGAFLNNPIINANLIDFLDPNKQNIREILSICRDVKKEKNEFMEKMKSAREKILPVAMQLKHKVNGFKDYWEHAQLFARDFAKRTGVMDECETRGIEGLLEIRTVRLAVGAFLSYIYAKNFEGRTPKIGDSRDLQHAVTASAADIFVIEDGELERLLRRVPIENLEIMRLRDLLEMIC